jgi:hypothetical protein
VAGTFSSSGRHLFFIFGHDITTFGNPNFCGAGPVTLT